MKRYLRLLSCYLGLIALGLGGFYWHQHLTQPMWCQYPGYSSVHGLYAVEATPQHETEAFQEFSQAVAQLLQEGKAQGHILDLGYALSGDEPISAFARYAEHQRLLSEIREEFPEQDWTILAQREPFDLSGTFLSRRFRLGEVVAWEIGADQRRKRQFNTYLNIGTPIFRHTSPPHVAYIGYRAPPQPARRISPIFFYEHPPKSDPTRLFWALPIPAWVILLLLSAIPFTVVYLLRPPLARALRIVPES